MKCVVENLSNYNNKELHFIRDYAILKNALFETRLYNSYKFSEDRYYIERLPAFHVYANGIYLRTFYPNTRPIQHVQECIDEYLEDLEKRQKRRDYWRNALPNTMKAIAKALRKLFHRKTRMELAQEEREFQARRRASDWH